MTEKSPVVRRYVAPDWETSAPGNVCGHLRRLHCIASHRSVAVMYPCRQSLAISLSGSPSGEQNNAQHGRTPHANKMAVLS